MRISNILTVKIKTKLELLKWWKTSESFAIRIFIVALILRLIPVIIMKNMGIGLDDMFQYDMLARSISAGNGYRWYAKADLPVVLPYLKLDLSSINYDPRGVLTSFRPPLYPTFLAIIYLIFGIGAKRFFIVRIIQAILAAWMAPLTYFIGKRLYRNQEKVGQISAWVITLYPMLVIYPLSIATENLFFILILGSFLSLLKARESIEAPYLQQGIAFIKKERWFLLSGILLGLACLTRSVAQLYMLFCVGWVLFILKEKRSGMILLLAAVVTVLPWIIRNSLLYGQVSGIESAIGYDLYLGYHPLGTGTFQFPQSLDLMTVMNDAAREKIGIRSALEFIRADPVRVFYLFFRRVGYFFGLENRAIIYFYSNNYFGNIPPGILVGLLGLFCLPFILVSISSVIGSAVTSGSKETILMALFLAGYITPHLLIIAEDRFHLAIIPFMAILSGNLWAGGWNTIRRTWVASRKRKILIMMASIAVILLLVNWGMEIGRNSDKLALLLSPLGNVTYFSY